MKIITQLLKEFWLPLLLTLAWTAFGLVGHAYQTWDGTKIVNGAFVTFFGLAFWFGQWNRVKKQLRVEEGLTGIELKVAEMLDSLDKKTDHLVGHITGGDGYCSVIGLGSSFASLCNFHQYTLFDVTATFIDLDLMLKNAQISDPNLRYQGQTVHIGTLHSGTAVPWPVPLHLGEGLKRYININFSARNGQFYQQLRFSKVGGNWVVAQRTFRANPEVILQEVVNEAFPREADGSVDWSYPGSGNSQRSD